MAIIVLVMSDKSAIRLIYLMNIPGFLTFLIFESVKCSLDYRKDTDLPLIFIDIT